MNIPDVPDGPDRELGVRYSKDDLAVFTREEADRFIPGGHGDPQADSALAWELLYRLEPELYDQLAGAERLHPGLIGWLPPAADRIVEVGAGTGRLTLELAARGREVVAVEPATPLREILRRKLADADRADHVRVLPGFFDDLPVPSDFADLVVACSVLTPAPAHGGDPGLAEMERVCKPGGCVAVIWPNHVGWLASRGYEYLSFGGQLTVEFPSHQKAVELTRIFYPHAAEKVSRGRLRRVPFEVLGSHPPRDLAYKIVA